MRTHTYTCTDFKGHYPVGTAAVVTAGSPEEAAQLLNAELKLRGLPGDAKPENMLRFPAQKGEKCRILLDGNY